MKIFLIVSQTFRLFLYVFLAVSSLSVTTLAQLHDFNPEKAMKDAMSPRADPQPMREPPAGSDKDHWGGAKVTTVEVERRDVGVDRDKSSQEYRFNPETAMKDAMNPRANPQPMREPPAGSDKDHWGGVKTTKVDVIVNPVENARNGRVVVLQADGRRVVMTLAEAQLQAYQIQQQALKRQQMAIGATIMSPVVWNAVFAPGNERQFVSGMILSRYERTLYLPSGDRVYLPETALWQGTARVSVKEIPGPYGVPFLDVTIRTSGGTTLEQRIVKYVEENGGSAAVQQGLGRYVFEGTPTKFVGHLVLETLKPTPLDNDNGEFVHWDIRSAYGRPTRVFLVNDR
jgi:hypothetical protein